MATADRKQNSAWTPDEIRQAALAMPLEERRQLARDVVDSIEAECRDSEQSWLEEVRRRIAAYERGETELLAHDQVMELVDQDLAELEAEYQQ